MSEINPKELREFKRDALEFEVDVHAIMDETKVLIERTALKDVSGGGMCFVSKHPGLYSLGQRIFLHICMPATGEKGVASMECTSKVVWTHQMQSGGAEEQQAVIGVSMESLLSFKKSGDD